MYYQYLDHQEEFQYHAPDQMRKSERFLFDCIISDLIKNPPELLIFDGKGMSYGWSTSNLFANSQQIPFDYLIYFSQDDRFIRLMKNYSYLTSINNYKIYKKQGLSDG
jgi:hypothetical protein